MEDEQDYDRTKPNFSRSGFVAPLGTLINELKTKVDPDTDIAFRRMCNEAGTDVAGALRNYVVSLVHGRSYDDICYEAMQSRAKKLLAPVPNRVLTLKVVGDVGSKDEEKPRATVSTLVDREAA